MSVPLLALLALLAPSWAASPPAVEAEPARFLGLRPRDQLLVVGLGAGTFAGYSLDQATPRTNTWLPVVLGLAGGVAPGLVKGPERSASAGVRGATFTAAGAWTGWTGARLLDLPDAQRRSQLRHLSAASGDLLGLGLGLALPSNDSLSPSEWILVGGSGAAGAATARGLSDLVGLEDEPTRAGLELGLGWLGLAGSALAARNGRAELVLPRTALWTAQGAWIGGWLPALASPDSTTEQRQGGMLLGAGLGWTGASLLHTPPTTPGGFASGATWGITGAALGFGLPRLAGGADTSRASIGGMLLGGLGGSVAGEALARTYDDDPGDVVVVLGGQAWAVASGGAWSRWAEVSGAVDPLGAGATAWGINSALALGIPTALDMSPAEALGAGSVAVWGTWLAAAGSGALGLDPETTSLATATTGQLGLVLGGIAAAGPWDPALGDIVTADGTGLLGAGLGAIGVAAFSTEPRHLATGALAGSLVGLTGGLLLRPTEPLASPLLPSVRLLPAVAPWSAEDGSPGLLFTLHVVDAPRPSSTESP